MAANFIITEDETNGLLFFETLVKFGIFKNTEVISSKTGYSNVPDTVEECANAALLETEDGKLHKDVNIVVLFDTQFLKDYTAKQKYNKAKKALSLQKQYAEAQGFKYRQPSYLCFESLVLSCEKLLKICELGIQHSVDVVEAFNKLHRDIYLKQKVTSTGNKAFVDTNRVFSEEDYAASVGSYGAADTKTLERRFKVLLTDITRRNRNALALCAPSGNKVKLGKCWLTQTACGTQYFYCNSCYLGVILGQNSPVKRLLYLVHNSFIKNYFDFILWQKR